ncbi:hypothetical protein MKW94_023940 [Papaver nudicaule]|uniref:RING-type E3 ubiquitin transferase n=1 Tax=Papaver nudicaule TaxID=74823 RepID=A0AA41S9I6_PAPNU|nr:hypothetical protein [Papaver nudicaule]
MFKKNIINLGVNIQWFHSIYFVVLLLLPFTFAQRNDDDYITAKKADLVLLLYVYGFLIIFFVISFSWLMWNVCKHYRCIAAEERRIRAVDQGLDRKVLDTFPVFVHPDVKNKRSVRDCAVCLGEFEDGDVLRLLSCDHVYHTDCIGKWLVSNSTCPLCRSELKAMAAHVVIDVPEDHTGNNV